ncbi:hypothetical protein AMJ80_10110 [bacterium SM23_31]|nr:MAG: hypothetical protein AMJ80_10110 [bacterium SM23_31]
MIQRAKNGDTKAFDSLVMKYQQRLYFVIVRIVLNHEDADDVVQDTFIKAYRSLDSFDESYRFYTWLYRIAVNTALNLVKHRKHKESSLEKKQENNRYEPQNNNNLEDDYIYKEMTGEVRTAIKLLAPEMRTVFILRVFEEMSYKEIAETMGISIGTVMSRLNRARNTLKDYLQNIGLIQNSI